MNGGQVSTEELIEYLRFRERHYRELALRLFQENQALRTNTPFQQRYSGISYKDPTGDRATTTRKRT